MNSIPSTSNVHSGSRIYLGAGVAGVPHGLVGKRESVGLLLPNLEARLMLDDERDAEPGQPGELWLRGPTRMK